MRQDSTIGPEAPVLARVAGVSKSFGGVHALTNANLELRAGEVHALCGENGAGKSTLIRILAGIYAPDSGQVVIDGRDVQPGIDSADDLGVAVIHQESVACPDLDAVDNIFVGREPRRLAGLLLDRRAMRRQTQELLSRLGESIDIFRPTGELPLAQRQMIGIARALSQRCRLLIMDEPTASLSERETKTLFRIINQLRDQGVAILYVTHRLEEVFALADRVTVLRDGKNVATRPVCELTANRLIELMVGREIEPIDEKHNQLLDSAAKVLLDVQGLTSAGQFDDVSLAIHAGEVVGLAGLVGAGRSELALAIFGIARYDDGAVLVSGSPLPPNGIAGSIHRRLALVPEDRQHLGLVLPMSMAANISLTVLRSLTRWGIIRRRQEHDLARRMVNDLDIRAASTSMPAESLSGGNQQKLVLGKWLATQPRVLILDEPTRGVDVGAKAEIHRRIRQLARGGMATLVISSELPELLRLCDRIVVMREGQVAGEVSRRDANEQNLLELALPLGTAAERAGNRLRHDSSVRRLSAVRQLLLRREVWLLAMLLVTVSIVGAISPSFLSPTNLLDIAADAAPVAIMACAVTLVIVSGEIDISVGSLLGLTAAIMGLLCYGETPRLSVPAAVICSLFVALGVGAINGLLVTRGRVPSIIATLAMLTVLRGVTKLIMRGTDIQGRPESLREFATGRMLGVPVSVWVALVIASLVWILTRYTPLGRRIYAVGSNPKAASLLGISVGLTRCFVFALSGLLAGVAAIVLAPKNSLIQPNMGESLELLVVTCVVVGGTSISGGRGTIAGTLLAVLLLSLVPTALTYIGAPPQWRLAIQGAFILAAVVADTLMRPRRVAGAAAS
jgi:ABC-type sugar transport system ATPase subunit/ribose/xylose/arabinose/galactoside ABC-type transport system permease subunit